MRIPNFLNTKLIDGNGYLLPEWQNFFQELVTQLQTNLSDEGYRLPKLTSTQISNLQTMFATNPDPSVFFGDMIYDSTTDQFKININGTFRVVTVV